jgi:hypothetical protein
MIKKYDLSKVQNELKGASSYFKSPAAQPTEEPAGEVSPAASKDDAPVQANRTPRTLAPPKPVADADPTVPAITDARSSVRPGGRTPVRSVSRYAFEFYQDQIAELKDRSLQERIQGGSGNMSQMVRLAIDEYLTNHPRPEES